MEDDELVIRLQTTRQGRAISIRGVPLQTPRTTMQPSLKLRLKQLSRHRVAVPAREITLGSPGMDGPAYGGRNDAYDVLLLTKGTNASVFQAYR